MTILVAGTESAEGEAAHAYALREAARRGEDVVYFVLSGQRPDAGIAAAMGVSESYAEADPRDKDRVANLLDISQRIDASAIVVGVRRRSPVGKLLLGSAAQQIILDANAPVICVKPGQD